MLFNSMLILSEGGFFGGIIGWLFFAIALLFLAVYLQYMIIRRLKRQLAELLARQGEPVPAPAPNKPAPEPVVKAAPPVKQKDLPDPGLLYKYILDAQESPEKTITIGQTEGTIRLFSTEIVNDHLSAYFRILENDREKDIYNMPGELSEEYMIDLRRGGKALIVLPGQKQFSQMGSRQRLYIKATPDEMGDPTFPDISPQNPVRIRLGDRLDAEGRFRTGYFEFHLFTKEAVSQTKAGIPKKEKQFFLRLFKIYPGYDTAGADADGIYPMIDPFSKG